MTDADHPPQPDDPQTALPEPPDRDEPGEPEPRPSTWARRPPVITEIKSLFDQDRADELPDGPGWDFPRRAGPADPSPRPPVVAPEPPPVDPVPAPVAPDPRTRPWTGRQPGDLPFSAPRPAPAAPAPPTPAPATPTPAPAPAPVFERPAPVSEPPMLPAAPAAPVAELDEARPEEAGTEEAGPEVVDPASAEERPPALSVASAAAVRWARDSLATLGELDGRRMDRQAVDVNEHRIGKLEPEWSVARRIRSFVVLVLLTLFVAAVIAALLAIAVEVLSVAVNHAVSKSAGA